MAKYIVETPHVPDRCSFFFHN